MDHALNLLVMYRERMWPEGRKGTDRRPGEAEESGSYYLFYLMMILESPWSWKRALRRVRILWVEPSKAT